MKTSDSFWEREIQSWDNKLLQIDAWDIVQHRLNTRPASVVEIYKAVIIHLLESAANTKILLKIEKYRKKFLNVVYNRIPILLSKWIITLILYICERLQQNVHAENFSSSQNLKCRCAAGSDSSTLLSRYFNSCLLLLIQGRRVWGDIMWLIGIAEKILMAKAKFSVPLQSIGWMQLQVVTICGRLGEIMSKWKFFRLQTS